MLIYAVMPLADVHRKRHKMITFMQISLLSKPPLSRQTRKAALWCLIMLAVQAFLCVCIAKQSLKRTRKD